MVGNSVKVLRWRKSRTIAAVPHWQSSLPQSDSVRQPIEYFSDYFTPELLNVIVEQTNLYARQQDVNADFNLKMAELHRFLGISMFMGVYGLPSCRMYWKSPCRVNVVADSLGRNRWEAIKRFLHFTDNNERPADCTDRLYKIRPLVDILREGFSKVPMDEKLSIDEQVIPFKGKHGLKTYNPKKPSKWGYKSFVLSDDKGIITYNFDICVGAIQPVAPHPDCGACGNIVLKLAEIIPRQMSHKLYYDNWFTGVQLQVVLEKMGIHSVATVRANRLKGCKLLTDNELKAQGRGTHKEMIAEHDGVDLRVTKWYDNKAVHLLSTYASACPTTEVN